MELINAREGHLKRALYDLLAIYDGYDLLAVRIFTLLCKIDWRMPKGLERQFYGKIDIYYN
jgi:hypothetical protein